MLVFIWKPHLFDSHLCLLHNKLFVSEAKCLSYMCTNVGSVGTHRVAVQWNIYVQCGNHICSVVYVKYVYSAHCHMFDCSDFICGTSVYIIHIHLSDILAYLAQFGGYICF